MLFVKTHWNLNIELNGGPTNPGISPEVLGEWYMQSRFISPKKYKNLYDDGTNTGLTFMIVVYGTSILAGHFTPIPNILYPSS